MKQDDLILGCWRVNEWAYNADELKEFIYSVVDLGINCFDHADIYGDYSCELLFGEVLRKSPSLRKQIKLTSKCGIKLPSDKFPKQKHIYDTSFQHIISTVDRSLTNLATDYLDLLLIHRPDPLMNADEVANAFEYLHENGKVRAFGVSNFNPRQMNLLQSYLKFPLQTNQIEASVICHDNFINGNFDYCQEKRIRPQVWSPLAGGKVLAPITPEEKMVLARLTEIAEKYSTDVSNIATAWLLNLPSKPQILIGSGKLSRIEQLMQSRTIKLTKEDWFSIWTTYIGYDIA